MASNTSSPGSFVRPGLACLDTGASGHYVAWHDTRFLSDLTPVATPLSVRLPDGSLASSSHTGYLDLNGLPKELALCHVFPSFQGTLLSVSAFCEAGLEAHFTSDRVDFRRGDEVVLSGRRTPGTATWFCDLVRSAAAAPAPVAAVPACAAVTPATTVKDLVAFHHASLGSPVVSTLEEAVRRGFVSVPGLTSEALKRWTPRSLATAKGHLDRSRQGQRSTRVFEDDFPRARGPHGGRRVRVHPLLRRPHGEVPLSVGGAQRVPFGCPPGRLELS